MVSLFHMHMLIIRQIFRMRFIIGFTTVFILSSAFYCFFRRPSDTIVLISGRKIATLFKSNPQWKYLFPWFKI